MGFYRQKRIEAIQWLKDGDHSDVVPYEFTGGDRLCDICHIALSKHGYMSLNVINYIVCPGSWLVVSFNGSIIDQISDSLFNQRYEKI